MDQIEVWQHADKELKDLYAEIHAQLEYEAHTDPRRRDFPELAQLCRLFIRAWEASGG